MLDRLDAALRFQQEALNLRAQRQGNISGGEYRQCRYAGYIRRATIGASELKGDGAWTGKEAGGVALTLTSLTIFPPRRSLLRSGSALSRADRPSLDGQHRRYGRGTYAVAR